MGVLRTWELEEAEVVEDDFRAARPSNRETPELVLNQFTQKSSYELVLELVRDQFGPKTDSCPLNGRRNSENPTRVASQCCSTAELRCRA
jgi:hypothetical protein